MTSKVTKTVPTPEDTPPPDAENIIPTDFGKNKSIKSATVRRSEILHIDPHQFQIEPGWNMRNMQSAETREHIRSLVRSISEILPKTGKPRGILSPLTFVVKDNVWYIRRGHCRYAAVMQAIASGVDIPTIPVMRASDDEIEELFGQFHDNNAQQFSPIDKGALYVRARDTLGMDLPQIAAAIGMTASHVSQCIGYYETLTPHDDIMAMIESGYVSASLAKEIFDENENDVELAFFILRGAVELAKAAGANKAMPKHVRQVIEAHRRAHPELYEDEPAKFVEETETVQSEQAETKPSAESAPPTEKTVTEGETKSVTTTTAKSSEKSSPAEKTAAKSESKEESTESVRDEICTELALLLQSHKKDLYKVLPAERRGAVDRFIHGALKGKWEIN